MADRASRTVDATRAREHLRAALQEAGTEEIIRATGMPPEFLDGLLTGRDGHPPYREIKASAEARILDLPVPQHSGAALAASTAQAAPPESAPAAHRTPGAAPDQSRQDPAAEATAPDLGTLVQQYLAATEHDDGHCMDRAHQAWSEGYGAGLGDRDEAYQRGVHDGMLGRKQAQHTLVRWAGDWGSEGAQVSPEEYVERRLTDEAVKAAESAGRYEAGQHYQEYSERIDALAADARHVGDLRAKREEWVRTPGMPRPLSHEDDIVLLRANERLAEQRANPGRPLGPPASQPLRGQLGYSGREPGQ